MTEPRANGWICLHRRMLSTSWYDNPHARNIAVHLLLSATHADRDVWIGTRQVRLLRGQYVTGRRRLARETGIRVQSVRTALRVLKEAEFLTHEATHLCSIITIVNYNAYQHNDPDVTQQFTNRGVPSNQQGGPQQPTEGSQLTTKQQVNNITNKQSLERKKVFNDLILKTFEKLWEMYPRKTGKKKAFTKYKNTVKDKGDMENCYQALCNYRNSKEVKDDFIKYGSTWFNEWEDWVSNPDANETELDKIGDKYGLRKHTNKK